MSDVVEAIDEKRQSQLVDENSLSSNTCQMCTKSGGSHQKSKHVKW